MIENSWSSTQIISTALRNPRLFFALLNHIPSMVRAIRYANDYKNMPGVQPSDVQIPDNPLLDYARARTTGPGLWKWQHYYEIYHRHLARFVGREVSLLEIGIYSGGSLRMWKDYLGEKSTIYGVDIAPETKVYEDARTKVFIGDQQDRGFWSSFRSAVPDGIDIVIDDGGHSVEQQCVTLEETLPHLKPGGIFLCEDVHMSLNQFGAFAASFVHSLNRTKKSKRQGLHSEVTTFQSCIHSIHFYPYVVLIEKHLAPVSHLEARRFGTEWQPYHQDVVKKIGGV